MTKRRPRILLVTLLLSALAPARGAGAADQAPGPLDSAVIVVRTMMPEAGPSSFAVGLAGNIGFCYDPGRGGINYVWTGEFVDLSPTWAAKINRPAKVRGEIIYREATPHPLRLGGDDRSPTYSFLGYVLLADGVEFRYRLGNLLVRERILAIEGGRGLVRHFRLDQPSPGWALFAHPQPGIVLSSPHGRWDSATQAIVGAGGSEFMIRMERKE